MKASGQKATIGLTGGGTAGHVWPHFALFDSPDSTLRRAWESGTLKVVYFGSDTGMERSLVNNTMNGKWSYVPLSSGKFRRHFSWRNFTDPFRVIFGFFQALSALRSHQVDVLFSKGGFVAAPVVWAAWLLGIPVIIHESDVTPALATKLSLPFCKQMICAFSQTKSYFSPGAARKIVALGLPLRASLFGADAAAGRAFFGIKEAAGAASRPVMLIFGGSLGAEILNRTVMAALDRLLVQFEIIHVVGKGKSFEPGSLSPELRSRYHQYEFLQSEMKLAYAVADFALSRAGASSLFELAAARIPMIVVPLDTNQSRGDQIVNAEVFSNSGWAEVVRERNFTAESLVACAGEFADNSRRLAARERLQFAPGPDAANRVADLIAGYLWQRNQGEHDSHATRFAAEPK
jgi:UDP-N-acetylglucosamine--N-acetylmuramyl-(pentapeptide) pyrophosphoryl-undecaprenol N-acetylglucosamine transferase